MVIMKQCFSLSYVRMWASLSFFCKYDLNVIFKIMLKVHLRVKAVIDYRCWVGRGIQLKDWFVRFFCGFKYLKDVLRSLARCTLI